jgi:hypothetical protein
MGILIIFPVATARQLPWQLRLSQLLSIKSQPGQLKGGGGKKARLITLGHNFHGHFFMYQRNV